MSRLTHNQSNTGRAALIQELQLLGQAQSTEIAHFHHLAAVKNGTNITDSKTVSVLIQEGSMTAGELALRLNLTTGAVTSVIDRLESVGLAHRTSDPNDRRKVIVEVDHSKLARMSKVYESMGTSFEKLLQTYSTEELELLVRFHKDSIQIVQQEITKL